MDIFTGAALVIIVFISSTIIEKRLKRITEQNDIMIDLLKKKV